MRKISGNSDDDDRLGCITHENLNGDGGADTVLATPSDVDLLENEENS